MSGGSARPKRRRAAGAALRYEHRREGPAASGAGKKRGRDRVFGCLMLPAFLAVLAPVILTEMYWGDDIWGDFAPSWPGGAYAFAATVGALVPLDLALFVAPLTRMNWKRSKSRSLAWAAASLPGLAGGWFIAGVIGATWRPKRRRDWDADCHGRGGPCWVHDEFPYLWAAGLVATVAVAALLIVVLVAYVKRRDAGTGPATRPSTSAPPADPPPRSPSRTSGRRRPG
ncbi:hypothetical protein OG985_20555 [Streptomyces sp. NBC_00289]|uniref:hypothetical protein n=1 Tax=Streptomyces sp. NBC_00289 TaxID=2975703 RepID=UPI0032449404